MLREPESASRGGEGQGVVPWVVRTATCGRVTVSRNAGEVAFAVLLYSACSSSMLLINKLAVTSFPMASFVTAFQLYFCSVVVLLMNQYECVELEEFQWAKVRPYLIYVASFVLGLFTNMMALSHGNVETTIIFRACAPLAVAFLDWVFLGRQFPRPRSLLALSVIMLGAYGYIRFDKQFNSQGWLAYTWVTAYFATLCFSMTFGKYIMNQVPLKNMWSSVLYTNALGLPMTVILGIYMGELEALRSFTFNEVAVVNILLSSIVGVGISWSGFKSRHLLSATSYTVVGVMNKMVTVAVNALIWDQHASTGGVVSLFVCIGGGLMYQQAPKRSEVKAAAPLSPNIPMSEVALHASPSDCWVVLCGKVYDLTEFHASHPGGSRIITDVAGKDATALFLQHHPRDFADRLLGPSAVVGTVDETSIEPHQRAVSLPEEEEDGDADADADGEFVKPPLSAVLNAFDFESVAGVCMDPKGWAYYSSGADDEITLRENHLAFQRIWLKPRVLVNVQHVDTTADVLGAKCTLPLYFTATAMARLANEEGEAAIVRAAHRAGVVYMLPTLSSCTLEEMLAAKHPDQTLFAQLYVNSDRQRNLEYIRKLEAGGVRALFITVDAPALGRREKDMRMKVAAQKSAVQKKDGVDTSQGVTRMISSYIDPSLSWKDLQWFKDHTSMPIFLKGVQCAEDAVLAYQAGCAGCVLSNHGGRQLDTARSGVEILEEVMPALDASGASRERFKVFIDGGVRRAGDIFKAIALGATAVGVGRPVLYALASYGQQGVERLVQLLRDELEMVQRLAGTPTVADITRNHVITHTLSQHSAPVPRDHLKEATYRPSVPVHDRFRAGGARARL